MTKIWDVAIIGSGPAGLTAAIYVARGNATTLVLAGEKWGGQLMLTTVVDNFPGFPEGIDGPDLMLAMRRQAERFGVTFVEKNVTSVDFESLPLSLTASGEKYQARSVIISAGADTLWLGVPGERELIGRGVASCAPCDAPFFKEKKVVVVGGGDSAMEETLVLTKYVSEVVIIHRRSEFRASKIMQEKVLGSSKVKVIWDTEVIEVVGDQKVEGVKVRNIKTKRQETLATDGVFVAIGHTPSTKIFADKIKLDEKGYVVKSADFGYHTKTNIPGVFVAGDVHDYHYKQAVTAAGFGCMAGMDALAYLGENSG